MNHLRNRILEITWLVLSILSLTAGVHKTIVSGFGKSYIFFIMAVVAFISFRIRRDRRLKSEKPS